MEMVILVLVGLAFWALLFLVLPSPSDSGETEGETDGETAPLGRPVGIRNKRVRRALAVFGLIDEDENGTYRWREPTRSGGPVGGVGSGASVGAVPAEAEAEEAVAGAAVGAVAGDADNRVLLIGTRRHPLTPPPGG